MDTAKKLHLITRNTEEVITEDDLKKLLEKNVPMHHYIGFEISGKIHLGTGLVCMQKVKDFMDAGVDCSILLADWHTWINDKLGGDRELIKKTAVEYFQEGLKSAFKALGGDPEKLKFILASDFYHNNDKFWETVISVSKNTTLSRMQRSITILGKKEGTEVDFAKLLYPAMQVSDIFSLGKNLAHAGIDQRKAHVIARDVALKDENLVFEHNGEKYKPVAIHHPLILGLGKPTIWPLPEGANIKDVLGEMKMSKSVANSAIFIHDSEEEIRAKMNKAFCPEKEITFNPVLDWAQKLVFKGEDKNVTIKRDEKFGGDLKFDNYQELESAFAKGDLHPMDLKSFVADYLVELLAPIRKDFSEGKLKEALADLGSKM